MRVHIIKVNSNKRSWEMWIDHLPLASEEAQLLIDPDWKAEWADIFPRVSQISANLFVCVDEDIAYKERYFSGFSFFCIEDGDYKALFSVDHKLPGINRRVEMLRKRFSV